MRLQSTGHARAAAPRRTFFIALAAASLLTGASFLMAADGPSSTNSSQANPGGKANMGVSKQAFGRTNDGQEVEQYTLNNGRGVEAKVITYGARLAALEVPDREGHKANIVLGFDSLDKYLEHTAFFGCTTGRFANRIAKGKFRVGDREYQVATNNGENHLHGGTKGLDKQVWKAAPIETADAVGVRFTLVSPDGDGGYPGNLDVTVTYTLNAQNELKIDYVAKTDKPTVVNLTNHAYWNLAGSGPPAQEVLGHELTLESDKYLPVDDGAIPTGELADVKGTPFDFTKPHTIGERIAATKKGVPPPGGYDHCYVLRNQSGQLSLAARVVEPKSGRVLEIRTTEPGIQFYSGNFLDGDSKNGGYQQHAAFCLETQHFPDSPNQPKFPSTVLKPGETFRSTTIHKLTTDR